LKINTKKIWIISFYTITLHHQIIKQITEMKKLIGFFFMLSFFGSIIYFVAPKEYTKSFNTEIDAKIYIEMHPNFISASVVNYNNNVYIVEYTK